MLVIGEREMNENKIAVRRSGQGDEGAGDLGSMTIEEFVSYFNTLL